MSFFFASGGGGGNWIADVAMAVTSAAEEGGATYKVKAVFAGEKWKAAI